MKMETDENEPTQQHTRSSERLRQKNPLAERAPLADMVPEPMVEQPSSALETTTKQKNTPISSRDRPTYRKRQHEEDEADVSGGGGGDEGPQSTSPSGSMNLMPDILSNQQTPGVFKFRRRTSNQPPIDFFSSYSMPIEVLRIMFKNLNKRDMCCAMRASKAFYNAGVTCDNWDFVDMYNKRVMDTALLDLLERKVKVLRLSDAQISANPIEEIPKPLDPPIVIQLTHLDMGRASFVRVECICAILRGCKYLQCLSMEAVDMEDKGTEIGRLIGANPFITHLDLALTTGLTDEGIRAIVQNCQNILELNLSWCGLMPSMCDILCRGLSDSCTHLNISGTAEKRALCDQNIFDLVDKCSCLVEVDASDNLEITADAVEKLLNLHNINVLSFNRCYGITPNVFLECGNLLVLNVHGTMTEEGERRLAEEIDRVHVNTEVLNYVAKPTIPPACSSIWKQRTRDIY